MASPRAWSWTHATHAFFIPTHIYLKQCITWAFVPSKEPPAYEGFPHGFIDHSVSKEIHSKLPSCQRCSLPKTRQQHRDPSEPTLTDHLKKPGAPNIVQNAAKFKHATDAYTMAKGRRWLKSVPSSTPNSTFFEDSRGPP
jgi:hypothetical protein